MEFELIDIDARKHEICNQDSYEKAHDFAAKLINDLQKERDKLLHGECARCEDKQHAIDALNAYVARLTDSTGTNLAYVERCLAEHRVEELCSDDFAGVYFQAEDVAREIGKIADRLATDLARTRAESLRVVKVDNPDPKVGYDWYMTPDGLGWLSYDKDDNECIETPGTFFGLEQGTPVRLELWEASE